MIEYNNILDIFDRMVDMSDQLHAEHSSYADGFDKALYTLKYALLQYVPINLHVENRKLKRLLEDFENTQFKLKESNKTKDAALQENKRLRSENHVLTVRLNSLKSAYDKNSKNNILK